MPAPAATAWPNSSKPKVGVSRGWCCGAGFPARGSGSRTRARLGQQLLQGLAVGIGAVQQEGDRAPQGPADLGRRGSPEECRLTATRVRPAAGQSPSGSTLPQRGVRAQLAPAAGVGIQQPGDPLRDRADLEVGVKGGAAAGHGNAPPGGNGGGGHHWMAAANDRFATFVPVPASPCAVRDAVTGVTAASVPA